MLLFNTYRSDWRIFSLSCFFFVNSTNFFVPCSFWKYLPLNFSKIESHMVSNASPASYENQCERIKSLKRWFPSNVFAPWPFWKITWFMLFIVVVSLRTWLFWIADVLKFFLFSEQKQSIRLVFFFTRGVETTILEVNQLTFWQRSLAESG